MSSSPMLAEPKPEIPATTTPSAGVLTTERLQSFQADFDAKAAYKIAQNAVTAAAARPTARRRISSSTDR